MNRYERRYVHDDGAPRVWLIFFSFVGALVVVAIVFTILGFANDWFQTGRKVISPANVSDQYARVITDWESLKKAANNACSASLATDSPNLIEDPALAYASTYRTIVVDYNSRQADIFKAKLVGPPGYPPSVPAFDQGPGTDWCSVAVSLSAIK